MKLPAKLHSLLTSQGLQQTFITVVGNTAATGLSAVSIMLTSRLLGPTTFGIFSVGFALTIVLSKVNHLGLSAALHKFVSTSHNKKEQAAIIAITLRWRTLSASILFFTMLLLTPFLKPILKIDNEIIWYSSITLGFVITFYDHTIATLQSLHLFGQAVIVNAVQASSKLLGAIFFFILQSSNVTAMYLWYLAAPISSLIASKWLLPSWLQIPHPQLSPKMKSQVIDMAAHSSIIHISNNIIEHIVILMVQVFLTSFETGLLGGVYRVAMLFSLISISLGNVLFPRVARYASKKDLQAYYKKAWVLSAALISSFLLTIPVARYLLLITIGDSYTQATSILIILLGSVFIQMATVPFTAIFYTVKQTWFFSLNGIILLTTTIVGNLLFLPSYGLAGAAWVQVLARCILLILSGAVATIYMRRNKAKI